MKSFVFETSFSRRRAQAIRWNYLFSGDDEGRINRPRLERLGPDAKTITVIGSSDDRAIERS
ncbi:hypothetical protein [Microvirga sesbaniae]|uniref:hypothetical protein n=1 Tax=Microvirga sesbaniae TaxID=681392 RepID=UPI0021CA368A|nr:hypothetical protein [Microvirga sp. HBU67692]